MQIKNCKDIELDKVTALIYGASGAGKTFALGTLPPKTIIVSMERGLLTLRGKDVDYVEVEGGNAVQKVGWLRHTLGQIKESDYDNVGIDSLTEIAECFVEYAKEEYPADAQALKMWGYYNKLMTNFIKYCRDLDKNIIFTALVKTDKDEIGRRFHLPNIAGSVAQKGIAHFDFVFSLLKFEKDGEEKRALLTACKDGYICKDRSSKLNEYEAPDLGVLIDKLNKE